MYIPKTVTFIYKTVVLHPDSYWDKPLINEKSFKGPIRKYRSVQSLLVKESNGAMALNQEI